MKKNKLIPIMGTILAILIVILLVIVTNKKDDKDASDSTQKENLESVQDEQSDGIAMDDNLVITSVNLYSGPFVEDGSDEKVEDVLMITVKNKGEQTLQYAEAIVTFDDVTAEFAFSTLRPGESMTVLEKNRLGYLDKEVTMVQIQNVVYFEEEPDLCIDKFELTAMDGAFNVKNISGEDLTGNIAIYYKNKQEDVYHGGITYRAVIEGGIEKDGIKQIMTSHYKVDECEVMFVGYTEME